MVDVDDLVQIRHAVDAVAEAGAGAGMVQRGKQGLVQNFIDQTGLSRTGHAGDADEGSQRNVHIHIFQVVFPRAANAQGLAVPRPPGSGNRDFLHAGQVLSRYGTGTVYDILQRSRRHDLAAVTARPGANVYNKIGGAHGVLVVLHHDQGVAQIPQMLQRSQQLIVVPLFDNEEIGSRSKQGADSVLLSEIIKRIMEGLDIEAGAGRRLMRDAFMLSLDVAHATHPNYSEKSDPTNQIVMGRGVALKSSASQRYVSDSEASAVIMALSRNQEIKIQRQVNRSGMAGGQTLGPIASSYLPVRAVDMGIPILAMHSAVELGSAEDYAQLEKICGAVFEM